MVADIEHQPFPKSLDQTPVCYKKFGQRFDWVSAQERSDITDFVTELILRSLASKTSGKTRVNFYLVGL